MKITFTREAIADHLINAPSAELESKDTFTYYLHMTDDQQLLNGRSGADITFKAYRDFTPYAVEEDPDDLTHFFDSETLDTPDFAAVVDDLYEQAVAYFNEMEEDE